MAKKKARRTKPKPSDLAAVIIDAVNRDDRSPYAIAQAAEIRPEVLTRFLKGERDLKLATAKKVCEALGLGLRQG